MDRAPPVFKQANHKLVVDGEDLNDLRLAVHLALGLEGALGLHLAVKEGLWLHGPQQEVSLSEEGAKMDRGLHKFSVLNFGIPTDHGLDMRIVLLAREVLLGDNLIGPVTTLGQDVLG